MPAFQSRQTFDTSCGRYGVIFSIVTPGRNLSNAMILMAPPNTSPVGAGLLPAKKRALSRSSKFALSFSRTSHDSHEPIVESSRHNFVTGVEYAAFRVPSSSNHRCNRRKMETDHCQRAKTRELAIWPTASASAGSHQKGADRAIARA